MGKTEAKRVELRFINQSILYKFAIQMNNMAKHINKMDELIGRSTLSATLPLLTTIAKEHGLRLNRSLEFKKARILLATRYRVTRMAW